MGTRHPLDEVVESLRKQAANYRAWAAKNEGTLAEEYLAQADSTDRTIADLEKLIDNPHDN